MTAVAVALCGFLATTGVFIAVIGLQRRPAPRSTTPSTGLWTSVQRRWRSARRIDRSLFLAGLLLGLVTLALTGIPVAAIAVPVLVALVPALLRTPANRDIDTLAALDRWIRLLTSSMPTGKSVPDAIRATARQVPASIAAPTGLLVARLDDRWTVREALLAFADDLDSPDADAAVAALVLAAERGGRGAIQTLSELSDTVQDRLRALREIEAEREKPRIVVRQISVITLAVVGVMWMLRPGYFAPLGGVLGQVILAGVVLAYLGSLAMMRRRTRPRHRDRLLARREVSHVRMA